MSADNDSAHNAEPVRDNPVVALVMRARGGDERAWAALVERYAPLIWSLCRRYRLGRHRHRRRRPERLAAVG